jgi:hypothetical protein
MFDYIEKLRAKPEGAKRRFAFLAAFFVAGILFVVWLSVLFPDWREAQSEQGGSEATITPTSAMGSTFAQGFAAIKDSLESMKESISAFKGLSATSSASSSAENAAQ